MKKTRKRNIDYNNKKAITAFSDQAHLLYPVSSLRSEQKDQSKRSVLIGKKGIDKTPLATLVQIENE
ncbi:MAG: hypothetical protein ACUZ9M_07135 [Candidatus Scalindua sp.]